ncbi:MAG TPA: peptide ABC transporter substrate-binding protein [Gammaproteobacteria bacterium]
MKGLAAGRVVLFAALSAALAIAGCDVPAPATDDARVLRRGITAEIGTLDPHFSVLVEQESLLMDLYEGLVRLDARGNVVPAAAESWTIGADGREYTFVLRDDVRWSDGSPVEADDFVWSFRRLVDPATGSPHAGKLVAVRGASEIVAGRLPPDALGVTALDPRTLRIELETPAPYFLAMLTYPALVPLHAESVERFDREFTRPENLVSNGPYVLSRRNQEYVELVRSQTYRNADRIAIERVRYVPFEQEFAQFTAYRVADIDLTDVVPASGLEIVRDQFPGELYVRPTKDTFYYAFNLREGPLADSPALREALSATIRREIITAEVTGIRQPPAYSFVPPMFAGYEPARVGFADLSPEARDEAAKALLERDGGAPPRLRVLYNTNEGIRLITVAVASMWRAALGVETELRNMEFGVFLDTLRDPSAWDVARLSWRADFDDPYAFLEIFRTGSPNNFVGFSDPVYDELLERSHRETSSERRLALLHEAEQRLLDAHAIAPVFFYVDRVLAKPWVDIGDRVTIKPLPTADLRWAD